jgi:hypothetical protein
MIVSIFNFKHIVNVLYYHNNNKKKKKKKSKFVI